jgi:transposase
LKDNSVARQAFKYRLYPTKKQEQVLFWTMARCRELYNAALSEWKDAYQPYEKVSPRYTSQVCSQCGTVRKKTLDERWHSCECGCELDRDTNAAINILWLGRSQRGDAPCVEALGFSPRESSQNVV